MGHRTSKGPFSIANYGSLLECSAPLANKLRKMERQIWQRRLNSKRIKHLPGFLQHLFTNQSWTFRFFLLRTLHFTQTPAFFGNKNLGHWKKLESLHLSKNYQLNSRFFSKTAFLPMLCMWGVDMIYIAANDLSVYVIFYIIVLV